MTTETATPTTTPETPPEAEIQPETGGDIRTGPVDGIEYPPPPNNYVEAVYWAYTATRNNPEMKDGHIFAESQDRYDARYGYGAWGRDYDLIHKGLNYVLAYDPDPNWDENGPTITAEEMGAKITAAMTAQNHEIGENPWWVEVVDQLPPRPIDKALMPIWSGMARTIAKDAWNEDIAGTAVADPIADLGARKLTDIPTTAPAPLLVGRLHPTAHTILFGEGGVGKGTLASWWTVQLVRQGHTVLILDYEDHPEEWSPRVYGLGGEEIRDHVYHVSPLSEQWTGTKGAIWTGQEDIKRLADRIGATYLIVDSIVAAVGGADAGSGNTESPSKYAAALTHIGRPCLSLAHVPRSGELKYPFGSIFWHSFARFTWSLKWSENHKNTILEPRKHNNYPRPGATTITVTFRNDIPMDVHEEARSTVITDMIWETLTEPMTLRKLTETLNKDIGEEDSAYKENSISHALDRGLKATAKATQRFRKHGDDWSRYES